MHEIILFTNILLANAFRVIRYTKKHYKCTNYIFSYEIETECYVCNVFW